MNVTLKVVINDKNIHRIEWQKMNTLIQSKINEGKSKTTSPIKKIILLGIFAGIFIAFGASSSSLAIHAMTNSGLAKLVAGTIFPVGLMMIVLIGGELFTGNNFVMAFGAFDKKVTWKEVAKIWGVSPGKTYYIKETGPPDAEGYGVADGVIRLTIEKAGYATYQVDVIADAEGNEPSTGFTVHGVNIDEETGKSNRWKIENSWGTGGAQAGYHMASDAWFDYYVYQAVVNKKYLGDYAAALDGDMIELEPWDPMGSLAD